jgi:Zn-dependent M32 family carboxypeptidase
MQLKEVQRFQKIAGLLKEDLTQQDFPKFKTYLESIVPKNKRIAFFIRDHRLLIGYFPEGASMADISKLLPTNIIVALEKKFASTPYTLITNVEKKDPYSNKKMKFVAISAKDQATLAKIEQLF